MRNDYPKRSIKASGNSNADLRRYGSLRRSRVATLAQRRLVRQFAVSPAHARVIAELQGYHG